MRHEFRAYCGRPTFNSLHKFIQVNSARLQTLIEMYVEKRSKVSMIEAMHNLRDITRTDEALARIRQIFTNKEDDFQSTPYFK